jgi:hypothetical protein
VSSPFCVLKLHYASREVLYTLDIIPCEPDLTRRNVWTLIGAGLSPDERRENPPLSPSHEPELARVKQRNESAVPGVSAVADRLRRAREELEEAERASAALEASIASGSGLGAEAGSGKRKRGEGDVKEEEDDEALLRARKKMEKEMKDALKDYNGAAIDLTDEDVASVTVKGETIDLTDE